MPDTLLKHGQGDKRKASKDEFNRHKQDWGLADTGFPGGMCPHKFNVSGRLLCWSRTLLLDTHRNFKPDSVASSVLLSKVVFLAWPLVSLYGTKEMKVQWVFHRCLVCVCVFLVLEVRLEVCALCWNERYFFGQTVGWGVLFGLGSHGSLFWWFATKSALAWILGSAGSVPGSDCQVPFQHATQCQHMGQAR